MKTREKAVGWGPGGQGEEGGKGEEEGVGGATGLWKRWCLALSQPAPCAHALVVCGLAPGAVGSMCPDSPHCEPRLMAGISQGQRPGHSLKHGVHPGTEGSVLRGPRALIALRSRAQSGRVSVGGLGVLKAATESQCLLSQQIRFSPPRCRGMRRSLR